MRTGITNLPLHSGHAPRWLFQRMVKLAGVVTEAVVDEYGRGEFLKRMADPFWFQAFSCVLGFDWHSSGTTTTTCGALKLALSKNDFGISVAGGKGAASRKTLSEIASCEFNLSTKKISELQYASRMSAKVDNSCVQDSYELYHHAFVFTEKGEWAVVQQGIMKSARVSGRFQAFEDATTHNSPRFKMNQKFARRYQWLSDRVSGFMEEPHNAISCDSKEENVLNMTAKESCETRKVSVDLVNDNPVHLMKFLGQRTLFDFNTDTLTMPIHHPVYLSDLNEKDIAFLRKAYELQPKNYEELVSLEGMGPKKIRALALISELVYGTKPSWRDPVKFSFAHGGKDGYPYPVNQDVYDSSIRTLKDAIESAKLGQKEKLGAIMRLERFITN